MEFLVYYINFKNFELDDIQVQIKRLQSEPESTFLPLEGAENPAILETVEQDEDKTKSVRGRRLTIGFNSYDDLVYANADTFATDQIDLQGKIITDSSVIPFAGNLVKDDITEAFQPRPNPVRLRAGDGFGALKEIELTESDGDIPTGHYRIIDYITLCLRNINFDEFPIYVAMNLYEEDTDPDVSHAFIDINLHSLTFETNVDERDNCYDVLQKILDAFGCFITFDNSRYYIIRWDEWDNSLGDVTELRFAEFDFEGAFQGYVNIDVDKNIAGDGEAEYEGHYLSNDSAQKRYQIQLERLTHVYNFTQPKEIPCNGKFTKGEVIDDVLPLKTYEVECWTMRRGVPGAYNTATSDAYIGVRFDANDYETERFVEITPASAHSSSSTDQTYLESQSIPISEDDKFSISVDWRLTANADFGSIYNLMRLMLHGDDGSYWLLGAVTSPTDPTGSAENELKWWNTSNWTVNTAAGGVDIDFTVIEETEWQNLSFDAPPVPVDGDLYVWLNQINQTNVSEDNRFINYTGIDFTYTPLINGTYKTSLGQQHERTGNQSKKETRKEMFISDSPRRLFKGAMKKFNGTGYVLTGGWSNYNDPTAMPGERLAKHILLQWWNQFKRTRVVIESDVQGLTDNIPSQINRWKIHHGDQEEKYFMLTSFTGMNFSNCGWHGVFVETSYGAGDRSYEAVDDPAFTTFKYIQ